MIYNQHYYDFLNNTIKFVGIQLRFLQFKKSLLIFKSIQILMDSFF